MFFILEQMYAIILYNPFFDTKKRKNALRPLPMKGFEGLVICQKNVAYFSLF